MRVITGLYKGRTLRTVKDLSVRPATDRVRQTIFNMLANRIEFEGASVLDLFAGSGSLGIEALSRGAAHVIFVEDSREALIFLEKNIQDLGCEAATEICEMDASEFVMQHHGSYNLVFADPPYSFEQTPEIPRLIFERSLVKPGGYLLVEHARELEFEDTTLYTVGPRKKFGRTVVTFFQQNLKLNTEHSDV